LSRGTGIHRVAGAIALAAALCGPASGAHAQAPTPPAAGAPRTQPPADPPPQAPKPAAPESPPAAEPPKQATPAKPAPKGRFIPSEEVSPDNGIPFPVDI
jgi:hypothetical protein